MTTPLPLLRLSDQPTFRRVSVQIMQFLYALAFATHIEIVEALQKAQGWATKIYLGSLSKNQEGAPPAHTLIESKVSSYAAQHDRKGAVV